MERKALIQLLRQMQTHQLQFVAHPASQQAYSKEDNAELTGLGKSSGPTEGGGLRQHQMQANAVPGMSQIAEERDGDKQTLTVNGDAESAVEAANYHQLLHQMHVSVAADLNQNAEQILPHTPASKMHANKDIESSVEANYRQLLHQMQASVIVGTGHHGGQRLAHTPTSAKDGTEPADALALRQLLQHMQMRQLPSTMAGQTVPQYGNPSRAEDVEDVAEETRHVAQTLYVNTM